MLIVLRIIFGVLAYWAFKQARMNAEMNPATGDLSNAYWTAGFVIVGLANAMVWAPYFGEKLADPLTGGTVNAEYKEPRNILMKLIRACEERGSRDLVCWLCFVQGV